MPSFIQLDLNAFLRPEEAALSEGPKSLESGIRGMCQLASHSCNSSD